MSDSLTLPEMMQKLYDKKTAILSAILLVFYCTALYGVTGLIVIGNDVFGMNGIVFAGIIVAIVMGLSMMGGLLSVAVTDLIQMIFMIVGVAIAVFFAWSTVGGWAGIEEAVALYGTPTHLKPLGDGGAGMQLMFVYVILSFSTYADPSFYQRFSASESPKNARKALLICICLWLAWDACVCILGLCGLALFPELSPGGAYLNVSLSVLPVVLRGLFLCGVIGAIVSTLSSYWLIGGTCIANDIYRNGINPNASEKTILAFNRLGIVFMGVFALLLASQFSMMASAWAFAGTMWTSGALVPVLGGLFYPGKVSNVGGFWSLVSGILIAYVCSGYCIDTVATIGIQPLFISLPISLIVFIIGGQFGKPSPRKKEGGLIYV
jgi:SSS family solute:Na+ symporter